MNKQKNLLLQKNQKLYLLNESYLKSPLQRFLVSENPLDRYILHHIYMEDLLLNENEYKILVDNLSKDIADKTKKELEKILK